VYADRGSLVVVLLHLAVSASDVVVAADPF
jgi:hypothetical protein